MAVHLCRSCYAETTHKAYCSLACWYQRGETLPRRRCAAVGCRARVKLRRRRYCSLACAIRSRTRESLQRAGREGGRARAMGHELRLLASVAHLDRRGAILAAYLRGQHSALNSLSRARRHGRARRAA